MASSQRCCLDPYHQATWTVGQRCGETIYVIRNLKVAQSSLFNSIRPKVKISWNLTTDQIGLLAEEWKTSSRPHPKFQIIFRRNWAQFHVKSWIVFSIDIVSLFLYKHRFATFHGVPESFITCMLCSSITDPHLTPLHMSRHSQWVR